MVILSDVSVLETSSITQLKLDMEIDRERDNLTLTDISLTIITPSFKNFIGEFFQTNLLSRFYPKGSIRFVLHDMISW